MKRRLTLVGTSPEQIDYTFGQDEISQRVREFDSSGNVTSDETHLFGHDGTTGSVRVLYDLAGVIAQSFTFLRLRARWLPCTT